MRIDTYNEKLVDEACALILQNKDCDIRSIGHVLRYLAVHAKKQKDFIRWRNFISLLDNLEKVRKEDYPQLYRIINRYIPKFGEFEPN